MQRGRYYVLHSLEPGQAACQQLLFKRGFMSAKLLSTRWEKSAVLVHTVFMWCKQSVLATNEITGLIVQQI